MTTAQYSVRRRLVTGTLACMVLILGGIGYAVNDAARHESEEIFSARLATSARVLEALVARQIEMASISQPIVISLPKELESAEDDEPEDYGHPYETKIAFQVWDDEGRLLVKSALAPATALGPLRAGFSSNTIGSEFWEVFALRSGKVWVLAAEKEEVRHELASELGTSILVPLAAGGLLMLLAVNIVLSFNTRSLRELADRISKREPQSLAKIELPDTPAELAPIVHELNDLLDRVKAAFEREKRFIDAAAHEIRTPIAALQVHIENAIRAQTAEERQNSLAEALVGLRRTTKLAEQLLAFSRITANVDDVEFRLVSLNEVCREVIAAQEPLLARRGQNIGLDAQGECHVRGEPYKLQRLVQNLVDNASRYGSPQGEIQVEIVNEADGVTLRVCNDGDPVPEEEIDKIFTPYYRIPRRELSGKETTGSGLGLAIVKEIAEQHKARVSVHRKKDGQGTVVSVFFPDATSRRAA
ncbi:MAG TPA: sensor histidine kinase [Noviherbaspirillum sp.]|nr:sensor histidine kinase [Noviherbaspirillum sp.]